MIQLQHSHGSGDSGIADTQDMGTQETSQYTDSIGPGYDRAHYYLLPEQKEKIKYITKKHRAPLEYTEMIGRPEDRNKGEGKYWFDKQKRNDSEKEKIDETNFGGEGERDINNEGEIEGDGSGYCPPSEQAKIKAAVPLTDKMPGMSIQPGTINTLVTDCPGKNLGDSKQSVPCKEMPIYPELLSQPLPRKIESTPKSQDITPSLPIDISEANDGCTWGSSDSETDDHKYGGVKGYHFELEESSDDEQTTSG